MNQRHRLLGIVTVGAALGCATPRDVSLFQPDAGTAMDGGADATAAFGSGGNGAMQAAGGAAASGGTLAAGASGGSGGSPSASGGNAMTGGAAGAPADAGAGSGGTGGTSPPGSDCTSATLSGHFYWFCLDNKDWDEAQLLCQSVGGHLAVIDTAEEQDFIVQEAGSNQWLIGLEKRGLSGLTAADTWEWVDGTDPNAGYANWDSGEPDGLDCGAMNADGTWRDWGCGNAENWICEIE